MESVPPQTGPNAQYGQPRQTAQVNASTRWITLSVGGDDLSFGELGKDCAEFLLNHRVVPIVGTEAKCQNQLAKSTDSAAIANLGKQLEALYSDLLTRGPAAKLVVMGYPRIFPRTYDGVPTYSGTDYCILDHYYPVPPRLNTVEVGMPVASARALDAFVVLLNRTIQKAIHNVNTQPGVGGRINYANTYNASTPRNCKGTTPGATVAGFETSFGHGMGEGIKLFISSATFHPTTSGQVMFAHVVESAFNFLPLSVTTPDPAPVAAGATVTFSLSAAGGLPPYTFGIASALPPWVTSFSGGTLSGTITPGTWPITFQVQDAAGTTATRTYTFSTNGTGGGVVTNYTGPGTSHPFGIAAGPDGALWFTNYNNSSIGRITTSGTVTNYTGPGISTPVGIAAGPDGALWFTNDANHSIGRITTSGAVTNYTGPGILTPAGIAAGPDGALWFTNDANHSIGRITTSGTVTNYTGPGISVPDKIAAGPDGALWFTNNGNNSIGRITTTGAVTNYTDPSILTPWGITAGPDGALWFTNSSSIGRITTP